MNKWTNMDQHGPTLSSYNYVSFLHKAVKCDCAVRELYAAQCGNLVQTLQDNLSFPSWRVTNSWSYWTSLFLKMGLLDCPETSAKYYNSTLRNVPEERRCYLHRGGNLNSRTAKLEWAEMTVGRGGKINFLVSVEMYTWYIQNITALESHWL
jgi:hypothetical protein